MERRGEILIVLCIHCALFNWNGYENTETITECTAQSQSTIEIQTQKRSKNSEAKYNEKNRFKQ